MLSLYYVTVFDQHNIGIQLLINAEVNIELLLGVSTPPRSTRALWMTLLLTVMFRMICHHRMVVVMAESVHSIV